MEKVTKSVVFGKARQRHVARGNPLFWLKGSFAAVPTLFLCLQRNGLIKRGKLV